MHLVLLTKEFEVVECMEKGGFKEHLPYITERHNFTFPRVSRGGGGKQEKPLRRGGGGGEDHLWWVATNSSIRNKSSQSVAAPAWIGVQANAGIPMLPAGSQMLEMRCFRRARRGGTP